MRFIALTSAYLFLLLLVLILLSIEKGFFKITKRFNRGFIGK